MEVITKDTQEAFDDAAYALVVSTIDNCEGQIVIGLSGGSTPKTLYTQLGQDDSLPWDRLTFFLVDDRYIDKEHEDSNQHLVHSTLLTRHKATFIAPDTSLPLGECIDMYENAIKNLTPDVVLLGMGNDGHIASLFPPVPPTAFGPKNVIHTTTDSFAVKDRISVTFPFLEKARKRAFLITGEEKMRLFRSQEHENKDPSMFPAHALFDEKTIWLLGDY